MYFITTVICYWGFIDVIGALLTCTDCPSSPLWSRMCQIVIRQTAACILNVLSLWCHTNHITGLTIKIRFRRGRGWQCFFHDNVPYQHNVSHCDFVTSYYDVDLSQHKFRHGTKLLPEPMLTYHWWVVWHSHDVSFPSERQCVNWVSKCIFVISSPFSRNHTVDGMRLSLQQQTWPTMHRFITPLLCRVVNPTWWSHFCVFLRNVISIASDNTRAEVSHKNTWKCRYETTWLEKQYNFVTESGGLMTK